VYPKVGLEDVEKRKFLTLPVLKLRPLGRPARSQSLYRLSYPGCHKFVKMAYEYNYCVSGRCPSSCFYLKHTRFRKRFCVHSQVEPTELSPIDRASPYLLEPASKSKLRYDRRSVGQSVLE
jgi:hypothetical protein